MSGARPGAVVLVLMLVACGSSGPGSSRDGGPPDTGLPPDAGALPSGRCLVASGLDLLIVVDTSTSMTEELMMFNRDLPLLFDALIDPSFDLDHPPVRDMHAGILTGDMGTGGVAVPTCDPADFGDDGELWSFGDPADPFCSRAYSPPWIEYDPRSTSVADFTHHTQCLLEELGTSGCGFQQPLESVLKAVTPSTSEITFHAGTRGHGDFLASGFLRPDSLLAIVVLTDGDDCAASDPEVFDEASSRYPGPLGLRCASYPDALHPLERYLAGLFALRSERPDLLALGLVAGIPPDLETEGRSYDEILADPRMQERADEGAPTPRLVPSCDDPSRGVAFPPRRLVSLARALPEQSTVHSICTSSGGLAMAGIARLLRHRACERWEE